MHRLKAIKFNVENVMWLTPALILGIGFLPNVADSDWWKALGTVLFLTIISLCGWGWREN
ncbi:hypothetical protein [Paenibacillus sp. yr247]|uniref:hypothetical protein n=1 Tax=Paenibacillus sp. yr247 TaxID=1761880 RepID=UPI000B8A3D3D|nr:hypothetical protein [Paenibacillus sp. yr247]